VVVASYGYETWSLTVKEDDRVSVFDSRVLKKMVRLKGEELKGNSRNVRA
jgi:hypothetical protein